MLTLHSLPSGSAPGPPRLPWSLAMHGLVAVGTVCLALLAVALAPSCMLPRFGSEEYLDGGPGTECTEDAECPGQFLDCQRPVCANGVCDTAYTETGSPCDEDGGKVCDGRGECVECTDQAHCESGEICDSNLCVPGSCGDGGLNGDETDVDCGGSCAPCENGKNCNVAADCESGYCASDHKCTACSVSGDCQPGHRCEGGTCVECSGTGTCQGAPGETCETHPDCTNSQCWDGYCCNVPCDVCAECATTPGTCAYAVFTDPEDECSDPDVCQGDGTCGSIHCNDKPTPPGTGTPPECTGGVSSGNCVVDCTTLDACDGATIHCPDQYSCEVRCDGQSACSDAIINCPADYECSVSCGGPAACFGTFTINCSPLGVCALSCGGGPNTCNTSGTTLNCGHNECTATCSGTAVPSVDCGDSCNCNAPGSC